MTTTTTGRAWCRPDVTRLAALLLFMAVFGLGMLAGVLIRQNALVASTLVANAKADAYMLAALETAKACPQPKGRWLKP